MIGERDQISRHIRAEAAAWVARIRSDARTSADEIGFRTWLNEDVRHADAFDQVTQVWDAAGGVADSRAAHHSEARLDRRALVLGAGALLGVSAAVWWQLPKDRSFETRVGEQRRIALEDGSTVMLDTNTRILVRFNQDRRLVELSRGRAHFSVAKDLLRPFHVRVADRNVVAVGTEFDVDHVDRRTSIVLLEGRVAIQSIEPASSIQPVMLVPGDRLRVDGRGAQKMDRPNLAGLTAWTAGRAIFNETPLAEAVGEMNRYSLRPVEIDDPALVRRRISGAYATAQSEAFAQSVAVLLSASVEVHPTKIIIKAGDLPATQESS